MKLLILFVLIILSFNLQAIEDKTCKIYKTSFSPNQIKTNQNLSYSYAKSITRRIYHNINKDTFENIFSKSVNKGILNAHLFRCYLNNERLKAYKENRKLLQASTR